MKSKIENEIKYRAKAKGFDFTVFFDIVGNFFDEHNIKKIEYSKLKLALEELIVNISSYAYKVDGNITIKIKIRATVFSALIADNGIPFDPSKYSREINNSIDSIMNLENIGGRGLYLVRKFMNKFNYRRTSDSNIVSISILRK